MATVVAQSGVGAFSALVSKSAEHNPSGESLRHNVSHSGTGSTRVHGNCGPHDLSDCSGLGLENRLQLVKNPILTYTWHDSSHLWKRPINVNGHFIFSDLCHSGASSISRDVTPLLSTGE